MTDELAAYTRAFALCLGLAGIAALAVFTLRDGLQIAFL